MVFGVEATLAGMETLPAWGPGSVGLAHFPGTCEGPGKSVKQTIRADPCHPCSIPAFSALSGDSAVHKQGCLCYIGVHAGAA